MQHQVLVCDKTGRPQHWAKWQDAVVLKYKQCLAWEMGDSSVFHGGVSRMTGLRTQIDVGQIIFLKEAIKYQMRTPPLTNENLFARDMHLCAYCGREMVFSKLSRDHIVPTSKGGPNTWMNCVTACKICNHAKGNRLLEEVGMELLYVPYTPNHAEKLVLSNRNVLADQMEFLKSFLPKHSRVLQQRLAA